MSGEEGREYAFLSFLGLLLCFVSLVGWLLICLFASFFVFCVNFVLFCFVFFLVRSTAPVNLAQIALWQCGQQVHGLMHSQSDSNASLAKWLRRPPRERKIPCSIPACAEIFSGSSHTSDFKIGTPVATLPGAWCYRVSAGTGWRSVNIL